MEVKMQDANVCAKKQAGDNRLSKDNAALLLVDHQTGLFQLVRDYNFDEFKNNVLALADVALLYKLPVVLTTSQEQGPNGPIFPYLKGGKLAVPFIFCFNAICFFAFSGSISLAVKGVYLFTRIVGLYTG